MMFEEFMRLFTKYFTHQKIVKEILDYDKIIA